MICHYSIHNIIFFEINLESNYFKFSIEYLFKMSNKETADELFDLKTSFYLGSFQQAINEAQKFKVC